MPDCPEPVGAECDTKHQQCWFWLIWGRRLEADLEDWVIRQGAEVVRKRKLPTAAGDLWLDINE
jgi:hypothetical protein